MNFGGSKMYYTNIQHMKKFLFNNSAIDCNVNKSKSVSYRLNTLVVDKINRRKNDNVGFTLLEVLVAIAILAVSLMVLVSTQSSAAKMTMDSDRILTATMLAKHKLAMVEIFLEGEQGFSEQDVIEEDGDFQDVFPDSYSDYRWHSVIRKMDVRGGVGNGLVEMLKMGFESGSSGANGKNDASDTGMPEQANLMEMVNLDEISEELAKFIREITVTVSWQIGEEVDNVTFSVYVVKPTGPAFVSSDSESTTPQP